MSNPLLFRPLPTVLVIVLALLLSACKSEVDRAKEEQARREARQTQIKQELAAKFGAIPDWNARFEKRLTTYTVDVQEALIRSDKKPILIEAFIEDITQENNTYVARLHNVESPTIHFVLECTAELATKLRSREGLDDVAVIASISSVTKAAIKLEASLPNSPDEPPDVEVSSSEVFTAKGALLAVEFLE